MIGCKILTNIWCTLNNNRTDSAANSLMSGYINKPIIAWLSQRCFFVQKATGLLFFFYFEEEEENIFFFLDEEEASSVLMVEPLLG